MLRTKRQRIIMLSLVGLMMASGCNLMPESKKIDYKSAGKIPPLDIPPDLTAPSADDRFAIPDITTSGSATFSTYNREREEQPRTYSSSILPEAKDAAYIARSGTQRWLVVHQAPEDVWPIIKEFWQDLGFLIKVEWPDVGIMETDWAENRAKIPQDIIRSVLSTFLDSLYSTAERDKFRTRLERTDMDGTEIYISHRGMIEVLADRSTQRTIWQPRPEDPELEAEMLARLMMRFGAQEELARSEVASAVNGAAPIKEQAYMDKARGGVLIVSETFDRAWRRIGLALDRVGFTVEDRDRSSGVYFVRYADPDLESRKAGEGEGILSKLAFWRSDADSKAERYRIQVSEVGANSEVKVFNHDGTPEESGATNRILNLLYEQLK